MSETADALIARLAAIRRPSASAGSREAARLVADALGAAGAPARLENEDVHGTYWLPLGLLSVTGVLAGRLPRRWGGPLAVVALAGVVDDLWVGRQLVRRLLPRRRAVNVVAEMGPADASRTIVVSAHHDAAHSGLVFHPALPRALARVLPGLHTTPPAMWGVAAAPALVVAGARRAGLLACASSLLVMADIARSRVVPGANDNLSAVAALVDIARGLGTQAPPVRVVLLSTDAEESFLEGMRAFLRRHGPRLARETTTFVCLESVGGDHLVALDGEGMLKLHRYPDGPRETIVDCARRLGLAIEPRFRFRFATDGQLPLLAGYRTAVLELGGLVSHPRNYHWPTDDAAHVDARTAAAAARVVVAAIAGGRLG